MSVHSQSAAQAASTAAAPEFPRHVVTAVIVSHDGARWLPEALAGLLGQERPVQNVVGADTGSADDSAQLVAEAIGDQRVLHLARRSGFGTAVDEAIRTAGVLTPDDLPYLRRPSGWDPVTRTWRDDAYDMPELPHGEPVQWLWLLHDDCAPEPDALAELLRVADASPSTVIVGAKLRSWYDRRQLLEAGVTIARQRPPLDRPGPPRTGPGPARPGAPRALGVHRRHAHPPRRLRGVRRLRPPAAADARRRRPVLARPGRRPPGAHRAGRGPAARRGLRPRTPPHRLRRPFRRQPAPRRQGRRRLHPARQHPRRAAPVRPAAARCSAPSCGSSPTSWARSPARRSTNSPGSSAPCCDPARSSPRANAEAAPPSRRASCGRSSRRPARPYAPPSSRSPATSAGAPHRTSPRPAGTAPSSPDPAATTPTSWRSSSSPGSSGSPADPARCSSPCCCWSP